MPIAASGRLPGACHAGRTGTRDSAGPTGPLQTRQVAEVGDVRARNGIGRRAGPSIVRGVAIGTQQPGQHAQQGGLAGAVAALHQQRLAGVDRKRQRPRTPASLRENASPRAASNGLAWGAGMGAILPACPARRLGRRIRRRFRTLECLAANGNDTRSTPNLPKVGTTIFTVMSQLAAEHGAVNLAKASGFPGARTVVDALRHAGRDNQYAMMTGIPAAPGHRRQDRALLRLASGHGCRNHRHQRCHRSDLHDAIHAGGPRWRGSRGPRSPATTATNLAIEAGRRHRGARAAGPGHVRPDWDAVRAPSPRTRC